MLALAVYAVYAISSLDTGSPLRLTHGRRDTPGSCRARFPALHVGGRDRVAVYAVYAVSSLDTGSPLRLTHGRRDTPGSCRARCLCCLCNAVYAVYAISSLDTG